MPSALLPRLVLTLSFATVLAGSVLLPSASFGSVQSDRSPSPGPGYTYGVSMIGLPTDAHPPIVPVSGWNTREFVADGSSSNPPRSSPVLFTLSEPWFDGNYGGVSILASTVVDNGDPGISNTFQIGALTGFTTPYVICQDSEWSTTTRRVDVGAASGTSFRNYAPNSSTLAETGKYQPFPNHYACPYLVSFAAQVRVYKYSTVKPVDFFATWSAEQYATGKVVPVLDPTKAICAAAGYDASLAIVGCKDVILDLPLDHYCDGAPLLDVLQPATFARSMAFYADCLFHPRAGFDRHGDVSTAMSESALGQLSYQLGTISTAFQYTATCGNLGGDITSGSLASFKLDTCKWAAFADPMKTALSFFIIIGFGWWAIDFVIGVLMSMFNMKTPSPVGKDAK